MVPAAINLMTRAWMARALGDGKRFTMAPKVHGFTMERAAMPGNSLAVFGMHGVCTAHNISFDSLGLPIIGPPPIDVSGHDVTQSALPADLQELSAMMSI